MFDFSNNIRPTKTLANRLNYALRDIYSHGGDVGGFRFVARGGETAYLNVPGNPMGAVCVHREDGAPQATAFFHPSRTGKEAWQLSETNEGCHTLASDEDMDEDRFLTDKPGWEYDIVLACIGRFPGAGGKSPHKVSPDHRRWLGL